MEELLFLAHRIPYPPDKGDKIRAWNFLAHLAKTYRVHLGCFVDDPRDWRFTDTLRSICGELCFVRLDPRRARLRSLKGLLDGRPLTLPYYHDARLHRWVQEILAHQNLSRVFVYCSAMAQYVAPHQRPAVRHVADLVDVDSEKWSEYARDAALPKRWIYRREAARLRQVEARVAASFAATMVATDQELRLLRDAAPEAQHRVVCVGNGVDADYYSPDRQYENPYKDGGTPIAFVGAMNYFPNIDAVTYFVRTILPLVRQRIADARLFIVGSNPAPEVARLTSGSDIVVTGWVPDVRPYAAHARVIIAPLRIARGVQNKVLEGMAMGKPVVASAKALAGIAADADKDVFLADTPDEFAEAIYRAAMTATGPAIGRSARRRVMTQYRWSASLERLDAVLNA